MSAQGKTLTGIWAVFVCGGQHRLIGCLDPDDTPENRSEVLDAFHGRSETVVLHEAYELVMLPTSKGLALSAYPYAMLIGVRPQVVLSSIQTFAFYHDMDTVTARSFSDIVQGGRNQTRAIASGLVL